MKRILMTALICAVVVGAKAQDELTFKPFKFDISLGYAIPKGSGSKGGGLFAMEPKYAINDNITFGLRMELAATAHGSLDMNNNMIDAEVKASASYLATADYYFNTNAFRPFVGAGAGIFTSAGADVNSTDDIEAHSRFGFTPRVGFETGHFRAAAEYNFAGKVGSLNYNYIGLKLGFFFGGGRY